MEQGEVELMSTSSTLAEMMHHVTMIAPWEVTGTVETAESAAGNVTGTRTESAEDLDLANAADVLVHGSGREKETDRLEQVMMAALPAGVESERGIVGEQQEGIAGVGRGVEKGREEAGAGIARETGREARGWRERRSARVTDLLRAVSGCWMNMKEKRVRAWRSVETGTETETGTVSAATGTERGAGETETETGSTRGTGGSGIEATAERSATAPYGMTWAPKMTWATRMREEHHHSWKSTVRMG